MTAINGLQSGSKGEGTCWLVQPGVFGRCAKGMQNHVSILTIVLSHRCIMTVQASKVPGNNGEAEQTSFYCLGMWAVFTSSH